MDFEPFNFTQIHIFDCVFEASSLSQKSCPDWKDAKSVVAMLRCCRYSVEDCISVYKAINDDGERPPSLTQ